MLNKLQEIENLLIGITPMGYAETQVNKERNKDKHVLHVFNSSNEITTEKEVSYEEYMRATYGNKKDDILHDLKEKSRISFLNEYMELANIYTGWINNGRLFALNVKEKYVSLIYKNDNNGMNRIGSRMLNPSSRIELYTHYNPLNVDVISESVDPANFFNRETKWIISSISKDLIEKCDELIKNNNN